MSPQFFDNNTGLYFYSAVLQANTALIAFAAVFAVFRFQTIVNSIQAKDAAIAILIENYFARKPMDVPEEIRKHFTHFQTLQLALADLLADPNYKPEYRSWVFSLEKHEDLRVLLQERSELVSDQLRLNSQFVWPLISVLIVIVLSLCLLPLATIIHVAVTSWEAVPIAATVLLNVWALALNSRFVFRSINV
jgi:hypothetical protein